MTRLFSGGDLLNVRQIEFLGEGFCVGTGRYAPSGLITFITFFFDCSPDENYIGYDPNDMNLD